MVSRREAANEHRSFHNLTIDLSTGDLGLDLEWISTFELAADRCGPM